MAFLHRVRVVASLELLARVIPNRLEHEEARLSVGSRLGAEETVLEQRLDAVEVGSAHRVRRIEAESAGEDAQPREQAPVLFVQQIEAPVERCAQRLLALGTVARAAAQKFEPPAEPRKERLRRQELHPRRGELDRER
jgi:hypothetical protein